MKRKRKFSGSRAVFSYTYTTCISKGDFVSSAGMCLGGVALATDTVLRSLKWKIIIENYEKLGTEFS